MTEGTSPVWPSFSAGWRECLKDLAKQIKAEVDFVNITVDEKSGFTEALLDFTKEFNTATGANTFIPRPSAGVTECILDLCYQMNDWFNNVAGISGGESLVLNFVGDSYFVGAA